MTKLIVFLKYPTIGDVKSRLGNETSMTFSSSIYKKFTSDILNTLTINKIEPIIYAKKNKSLNDYKEWLGTSFKIKFQCAGNLGDKLIHACKQEFKNGYSKLIVIGTDCPQISGSLIHKAMDYLTRSDTVIGPAFDGGYYLIGLNKKAFFDDMFNDINWSTESVFNETKKKILSHNRTLHILPKLSDIDTLQDLSNLISTQKNNLPNLSPPDTIYPLLTLNFLKKDPSFTHLFDDK
ncbi:glycosyltransferase [bacterium]|jgi:uncharacterized protein|nr:glycosyltransferase [bacterium]